MQQSVNFVINSALLNISVIFIVLLLRVDLSIKWHRGLHEKAIVPMAYGTLYFLCFINRNFVLESSFISSYFFQILYTVHIVTKMESIWLVSNPQPKTLWVPSRVGPVDCCTPSAPSWPIVYICRLWLCYKYITTYRLVYTHIMKWDMIGS